jgi:PHP family Zn ribbon phosphoesterase
MGKGAKKGRHERSCPSCGAALTDGVRDRVKDREKNPSVPTHLAAYAHAAPLTGAKKIKKECCRSSPRCKGCPVMLMRAARLQEAGVSGKDLKKALKKARAA